MIPPESEIVKKNPPIRTDQDALPGLDSPLQSLKGIGPKRSTLFQRLGIKTLRQLLYHFPKRHEDRRAFLPIAKITPGQKWTVRGRISSTSLFRAKTGTVIFQISVRDETGLITAIWFNQPYMRRWFPNGSEIILFGQVELAGKRLQMIVPEFELIPPAAAGEPHQSLHMGRVVPIYPATSGLHQRELRVAVAAALKELFDRLEDPLPPALIEKQKLLGFTVALKRIHFPPLPEAIAAAQDRMTFDELLCFQIGMGIRRRLMQSRPGILFPVGTEALERWKKSLPFTLTGSQLKAIAEISGDMGSSRPMNRLLQGEVGSGKTVVAAFAMVAAVQAGYQTAVLAPTEVLARQHYLSLSRLLEPAGITVYLLTSSTEPERRKQILSGISEGTIGLIVGTHALLEPSVSFAKLGLIIIDEQQKFGVEQRNAMTAKGRHPDVLVLTATPIPRTLSLTLYGEMDVSTMIDRPAGRQPIRTRWVDSTRRDEVFASVRKELDAGRQAYVVCPRIGKEKEKAKIKSETQNQWDKTFAAPVAEEEPPEPSVATATAIFAEYQTIFSGYRVGLLHGRMQPDEQRRVFAAFREKEIQVLVATQLIEVGVDIPNATVMVIEGAERFGLSQLHQLRGRVGRGEHEGTCILVAEPKYPDSVTRMQTMVELSDGFKIAEEDLKLRGPGEMLGSRQSGLPDLKCLEWATQGKWLEKTRDEAEQLLTQDPGLSRSEHRLLKKEIILRFPRMLETTA